MENKETQPTNTKASMGSLIVEGGFEDQVYLSVPHRSSKIVLILLMRDFFTGRRISVIS